MGKKLAIALLVLFISIIGLPIGVLGLRCASSVNQLQMERFEKSQKEYEEFIERYGSDRTSPPSDPRNDPNVDPVSCNLPFWKDFISDYGYKREGVRNAAMGIITGTVVLDGLVVGAYLLFGKKSGQPMRDKQDQTHAAERDT